MRNMAIIKNLPMAFRRRMQNNSNGPRARIGEDSPFSVLEAYKSVRTNLLFSLASQQSKVVVISSALPGEGKSTTCSNLAITMAQTGAKVLLIDSDMRKPVQHKIFKRINHRGLSNLLGGFFTLDEVLFEQVVPGLDLITSGTIPPNPSELMGSDQMSRLLEEMSQRYEHIFLDTPPINVVSDASVVAGRTAGVVLVTQQGYCSYDELDKAIQSVSFAKANLLGVVINRNLSGRRGAKSRAKKESYQYRYAEE